MFFKKGEIWFENAIPSTKTLATSCKTPPVRLIYSQSPNFSFNSSRFYSLSSFYSLFSQLTRRARLFLRLKIFFYDSNRTSGRGERGLCSACQVVFAHVTKHTKNWAFLFRPAGVVYRLLLRSFFWRASNKKTILEVLFVKWNIFTFDRLRCVFFGIGSFHLRHRAVLSTSPVKRVIETAGFKPTIHFKESKHCWWSSLWRVYA